MPKESTSIRARLLKKFNDLIYIQGYEQTTVRQVAEECGIGRGHLYFYYSKKEQFPIALRKDLLQKIEVILDDEPPFAGYGLLQRFFASFLLVRFMIARRAELYRVQAEYASHPQVMDGFAEQQAEKLFPALNGMGIGWSREMVMESLSGAVYGELALLRQRYVTTRGEIDHAFLFQYFNNILFFSLNKNRKSEVAKMAAAVEKEFGLRAEHLMRRVYAMEAFNYAFSPPAN